RRLRTPQEARAERDPRGVDADGGKAVLARLPAERLDLLAGRLGLEKRVIDAARDIARVEVRPRLQAEAGGALAQHPAHPIGTAPSGRGVTGARRLLLVYELPQHRPHDRGDEVAVRHLQYVSSMALSFFTPRAS